MSNTLPMLDHNQPETTTAAKAPLLETRDLTKRFGALVANDAVCLRVEAGQIHAILGENGAGKSTLMKMLYGVYRPDDGEIRIDGEPVKLHPPSLARARGISMVFQDFRLVPALTVLENIALSVAQSGFRLDGRALRKRIKEVSERYNIAVDADAPVWHLDLGQRQRVEIIKVLSSSSTRVVIFDEPTSVLTPYEVDAFLKMVGELRRDGYGVLLITHKINEVLACADRATVLRGGKVVFSAERGQGFDESELISQMMGQKYVPASYDKTAPAHKDSREEPPALQTTNLCVIDDHGRTVLQDVEMTLRAGEITGVAGISGNGQKELMETLFGLRSCKAGRVALEGRDLTNRPPRDFLDAKMAYVSEDPLSESIISGFSVLEHMVLAGLPMTPKSLGIDWPQVRAAMAANEDIRVLDVAAPERRADQLSGGNVQRLVLARALVRSPRVLLVSYPSRGLDIGTTRHVHEMLLALRQKGSAILLISEDMPELFALSDRLVVLAGGHVHGPYDPALCDAYSIGHIMLGGEARAQTTETGKAAA